MATHSSILAWEILWTKEPGDYTVHGVANESDTAQQLNGNNDNRQTSQRVKLSTQSHITGKYGYEKLK